MSRRKALKPSFIRALKEFAGRGGYVEALADIAARDQQAAEDLTRYLEKVARIGTKYLHVDLTDLAEDMPPAYVATAELLMGLEQHPALMVVSGSVGLGKTALAAGLCRYFKTLGRSCRYATAFRLLMTIGEAPFEQKRKVREAYEAADLVVIDELGDPHTHLAARVPELIELIDFRDANGRATLMLTNLNATGLWDLYGEKVKRRCVESGGFHRCEWPRIADIVDARHGAH